MDLTLDPLSPVPLSHQIRDRVVEAIGRGELRRGDALASVRSLAGAFGINPATVSRAYDQLRSEGLVATNAKSGTFVVGDAALDTATPAFRSDWESRLATLLEEGRAHGLTAEQVVIACQRALTGNEHDTDLDTEDNGPRTGDRHGRETR
jgi:DNA-binding transcriptional regulator YhcF (GntR family)